MELYEARSRSQRHRNEHEEFFSPPTDSHHKTVIVTFYRVEKKNEKRIKLSPVAPAVEQHISRDNARNAFDESMTVASGRLGSKFANRRCRFLALFRENSDFANSTRLEVVVNEKLETGTNDLRVANA